MEREKLIKGLIYIAVIIVLCTVASRTFFKSGETLQDYAQKNPEVAYADNKEDETEVSSLDPEESLASSLNKEDVFESTDTEEISPDRITYEENFYYEPLSTELRLYITGTSFPAMKLDVPLDEAQMLSDATEVYSEDVHASPEVPIEITYEDLRYVHVMHYNFNGEPTEGELICNAAIAQDLVEIFHELYRAEYRIEKIRLIDEYGGDDNLSMEDNNTSCFNYRVVEGSTKLSKHAYGLAIDINPFYNPYVRYNEDGSLHIDPAGSEAYADRSSDFPYKIEENDLCLKLFKEHGFTWGGDWNSMKDYQHFQKTLD